MARMSNKVALVVGGAKGIGLAIAERLSAEGAKVFITSRRSEDAERAAIDDERVTRLHVSQNAAEA